MVFGSLMNLAHSPLGFALCPPEGSPERSLMYALIGVLIGTTTIVVAFAQWLQRPNLDVFPTVGAGGLFHSWRACIKFMTNPADLIREGYRKHNGAPFKVATLYHWVVVITNRAHIEELRSAREEDISFADATNEDLNFEFTLGPRWHAIMVTCRQYLRASRVIFPELREEVVTAFEEILNLQDNGWKSVPALTTVKQVVCRANNRTFVGLPLCRDPNFVALNVQFAIDAIVGSIAIGFFPKFLKPLALHLVTNVPKDIRKGVRHLRPIIEERRKHLNEYGKDRTDKPDDLLSWLMGEAGPNATVEFLTKLLLAINLPAIHSTSNVFTSVLYNLATNPHYVEPLREEVETIVETEGWSRASLAKMHKVDSFIKETLRVEGVDVLSLVRKAMKDFRFSDGTLIPKGTRINAGLVALHYDDALYENPEVFDPFRFVRMSEADGANTAHQLVTTSPEYLPFGHGRHACPGRFFAATELKTMLAHVVTTYDIKLEENTTRPSVVYFGSSIYPNASAKVMFRKRQNPEVPT